jgi:citryl-CoA synthetase large subunit
MNLFEYEGKNLFEKHGIRVPRRALIRSLAEVSSAYALIGVSDVVVKTQILAGKRGKSGGIKFCSTLEEVRSAVGSLLGTTLRGYEIKAILIEEKLAIAEEHYLSISYDTSVRAPLFVYSSAGGMEIEDAPESAITRRTLDVRSMDTPGIQPFAAEVWNCFLSEDARVVEINPLVKTVDGQWYAADAKVALDDDAFFRHPEWKDLEPRTSLPRPPTEREIAAAKIDEGEAYYRGTASKYIELDGDIAILFSGGGASIANMDALIKAGGKPANYTEYSGNPPREKVAALAKVVLSKPGLKGLWIAGGVANFTNVAETFQGIVDALDELKPSYPIVVRRAGPNEEEGMRIMKECGERNGLNIKLFDKETSMSETAGVLMGMVGD